MHDVGRPLHLLPAGDALATLLARCRAHVVIEREGARTGKRRDHLRTVVVIGVDDLPVIEKIKIALVQRLREQLESMRRERASRRAVNATRIVDGHGSRFEMDAAAAAVTAIGIAPRQYLAITVERRPGRVIEIVERSGALRGFGMWYGCLLHGGV